MAVVTNGDKLKEFLEEPATERHVLVSSRAAMRVFPFVFMGDKDTSSLALLAARCLLISQVALLEKEQDFSLVAKTAIAACRSNMIFDTREHSAMTSAALACSAIFHPAHSGVGEAIQSALRSSKHSVMLGMNADMETSLIANMLAELGMSFDELRSSPLIPQQAKNVFSQISQYAIEHPEWSYCAKWYEGYLSGSPTNLDVQKKIAVLPDEDWDKGAKHIAEKIKEIEEQVLPKTNPEDVKAQVAKLLSAKARSAHQANALAAYIEDVLSAYQREVCNARPDCIDPLFRMPEVLRKIEATLNKSDEGLASDDLEKLLPLLFGTIHELNERLRISKVKADSPNRMDRFKDSFAESAGEGLGKLITSKVFWGMLITGGGYLLGDLGGTVLDQLSELTQGGIEDFSSDITDV